MSETNKLANWDTQLVEFRLLKQKMGTLSRTHPTSPNLSNVHNHHPYNTACTKSYIVKQQPNMDRMQNTEYSRSLSTKRIGPTKTRKHTTKTDNPESSVKFNKPPTKASKIRNTMSSFGVVLLPCLFLKIAYLSRANV